jgi:hypothetical protein
MEKSGTTMAENTKEVEEDLDTFADAVYTRRPLKRYTTTSLACTNSTLTPLRESVKELSDEASTDHDEIWHDAVAPTTIMNALSDSPIEWESVAGTERQRRTTGPVLLQFL